MVNNYYKNYIESSLIDARVNLIRCPFEKLKQKTLKKGKIKIVSSGRLVREKFFEVFLDAISSLKNRFDKEQNFTLLETVILWMN